MQLKLLFYYLLLAIFLPYVANANCSTENLTAAKSPENYKFLKRCAEAGFPDAMEYLGLYYERNADGISPDYEQALFWYQKAAEKGNIGSMVSIANMYKNGMGIPKNFAKSLEWLQRAADTGDNFALVELARAYAEGKITPQNYNRAFKLYEQAANNNDMHATDRVGIFYLFGLGVQQNYAQAKKYFEKTSNHWILKEGYLKFNTTPEFLGLKLRNTTSNSLAKLYPNISQLRSNTYDNYSFEVFIIHPSQLKFKNIQKNGLLFHKDGRLECMEFVLRDDKNSKDFFALKSFFDKTYGKASYELLNTPDIKWVSYEVGYNIIDIQTMPQKLKTVITLKTSFFHSLEEKTKY